MTENQALEALKEKQYTAIIHSTEYKTILAAMCKRIVNKSKMAPNEATIESYFDCELFAFFRQVFGPLGFEYNPIKEAAVSTTRHITKGRADTAIGALIIEFKQPTMLRNSVQKEKAVEQISNYLEGMESDVELIGFVTDGVKGCFVEHCAQGIKAEPYCNLSVFHLDRLIQSIIKLKLTALSSKNLVSSFCNPPENNGIAFDLMKSLFDNLNSGMIPKTQMLFNEWKELFNLAHDDVSKQQAILDRKRSLEELLGVCLSGNDEEYTALFALQTAYAIIIKIVAYRIASIVRYNSVLIDFESLMNADESALQRQLASLEEGTVFRNYGIANLLEGDFFAWYCSDKQWTPSIAKSIAAIFRMLSMYSDKAVLNSGAKSADFFKELYQGMMPAAVRHSLGEYYTKRWLAQQVVDEAIEKANVSKWRGLDPCCGSGTFLTVMIERVLEETRHLSPKEQLEEVLSRVKGIDLNPIAVLTARVNYFINIAHLLEEEQQLEIPVYLGDSSYVPQKIVYDDVDCLEYTIKTLKKSIDILVPVSMVRDSLAFSQAMIRIEQYIKLLDEKQTYECLKGLVLPSDMTPYIQEKLKGLAAALVELERRNWDGIWPRIIANYLTTANLGKFDVIVGNPPWVDWKSLPSGYRDRIKALCISRKLFSGDRVTGGINLNICALISNVVSENWLSNDGVLGFLMPEPLIFQPSYEGFRNMYLSDNSRLYIQKLTNWTESGHPFKPVMQKFLTYYISRKFVDYKRGIDVDWYILKENKNYGSAENITLDEYFDIRKGVAATCHETKNIFTYIGSRQQLEDFMSIAGKSEYIGREGVEFYPQEMTIFERSGLPSTSTCLSLKNIQVKKSKYHVPQEVELLEKEYLHPLIKGVDISPFHVNISGYIVPFPYDERDDRLPIALRELSAKAPRLAAFYQKNKKLILSQTNYNEKIIGRTGEFYALARVGAYSFANCYVAFRDNTKWGAAVVTPIETDWGGMKRPLFQNHAVSICEDSQGNFITLDEAHFICGILNTPVAFDYITKSSDLRSFPIRPRIYIPKYDAANRIHVEIARLSQKAHLVYDDENQMQHIIKRLNELYLELARSK